MIYLTDIIYRHQIFKWIYLFSPFHLLELCSTDWVTLLLEGLLSSIFTPSHIEPFEFLISRWLQSLVKYRASFSRLVLHFFINLLRLFGSMWDKSYLMSFVKVLYSDKASSSLFTPTIVAAPLVRKLTDNLLLLIAVIPKLPLFLTS